MPAQVVSEPRCFKYTVAGFGRITQHSLAQKLSPCRPGVELKGHFHRWGSEKGGKEDRGLKNLCLLLNSISFQITFRHWKRGSWDASSSSLVQANWCSAYWLFFLSVNSWTQRMWINTSVPGNHVSHKRKSGFDFAYSFSAWELNQHAASDAYACVLLVKKDKVKNSEQCTDQCKDVSDLKTVKVELNSLSIKRIIWSQLFFKLIFKCVQQILVKL